MIKRMLLRCQYFFFSIIIDFNQLIKCVKNFSNKCIWSILSSIVFHNNMKQFILFMSFIFKVKLLQTIKTKNNLYMVYILKKKLVLVFFNLLLNFKTKEFQIILLGSTTYCFVMLKMRKFLLDQQTPSNHCVCNNMRMTTTRPAVLYPRVLELAEERK